MRGDSRGPGDKSCHWCYRAGMATQTLPAETPEQLVQRLATAGRAAQRVLAAMPDAAKAAALRAAAGALRAAEAEILAANAIDLAAGKAGGLTKAMLDRLRLDPLRLAGIADAVEQVAGLADPVGEVIDASERPNGLRLSRVRVPIGLRLSTSNVWQFVPN